MRVPLRARILGPQKLLGEALALSSFAALGSSSVVPVMLLRMHSSELMTGFTVEHQQEIRSP